MKYIIEIPTETYKKIRFYGKPLNQRDVKELEKALTQAEVCKTGKWIWADDVRCSRCTYKLQSTGLPSYCPNCGARMEG